MTPYQEFIAKSRYSRYLPEEFRREHWPETADRWINFFREENSDRIPYDNPVWGKLRLAITDLQALPSMRSIMTAGEALRRTNVAAYNCAYLPVDSLRSFDEAMYILLCGTGVGFSVENQYVSQLPAVPTLRRISHKIIVGDSKEGWCLALRELVSMIFEQGLVPGWDTSLVRPAGSPLVTFGGRASGPEPLISLFAYVVKMAFKAQGRQLTALEAHDIMCKIGEVVVVGGVRRSAMISLGDLFDEEHAGAKSGAWWEMNVERSLANNSAVYESKPSSGQFLKEWHAIYDSGSGERGIFNREASRLQAAKFGRRSPDIAYGTNPCSEIILRPYQFCNLSTVVVGPYDSVIDLDNKIELAAIFGTLQARLTNFPYLRSIWKTNTEQENLLGVSMTGIMGNDMLVRNPVQRDALLRCLRDKAVKTNVWWSDILGITPSAAVTCVKPEGTVSQLTDTKSGIHPGHSPFYIRRVRQDNKDPLTDFLKRVGVPNEPCVNKPNDTTIFSFPQKSEGINRDDITAVEHLELWLAYQRNYCEHKPSVTISVREDEWLDVGSWVHKNFDECTGVSFLPYDGGSYIQAPYEEISEDEYFKLVAAMPRINWNEFVEFDDRVEGAQMLSCTAAGGCSI